MEQYKTFIQQMQIEDVPWNRLFTAYGTAETYPELFRILFEMKGEEEIKQAFHDVSNFEHQSTIFPPAPFAMIVLVRIFEQAIRTENNPAADMLAEKILSAFEYYAVVCHDAKLMEHADPLPDFAATLEAAVQLLPEDCSEDELEELFEDPDLIPDNLFYSFYFYAQIVIQTLLEVLERFDNPKYKVSEEKMKELIK